MSGPRVQAPASRSGNVVRDSPLGLVPETLDSYLKLNASIWRDGPLSPADVELIRLRNARKVGCVFCKAVRYDIAKDAGLSEDKISQINDNYESSDLSQREKRIIEFCDYYLSEPTAASSDALAAFNAEFSEAELAHMSLALLLCNTFSRFAVSLGGMPEEGSLPLIPMAVPE